MGEAHDLVWIHDHHVFQDSVRDPEYDSITADAWRQDCWRRGCQVNRREWKVDATRAEAFLQALYADDRDRPERNSDGPGVLGSTW